jgi:hypothetical protein
MKARIPTPIRFTEEDIEIVRKLEKLTGLEGPTAVLRLALRETLTIWEKRKKK